VRAGHADPLVFTTWRLWFALPPLALVALVRRRASPGAARPATGPGTTPVRRAALVAGAGVLFASGAATAFASIGRTTLLNVTLIGALQPVVVIAAAVAFLGERTTRAHLGRAAVAVAGTAVVVSASSGQGTWSLAGDLIAVVSLALNSLWFLYGRWLRARFAVDPVGFMTGVLASAAVLLTPVAWVVHGGLGLPAAAAGYAALTMVVGTSAHLLAVWAHRWVPASVSSPMLLAQPVLIGAAAWALFGETPAAVQVAGALVVLVALAGMVRSPAYVHVEDDAADEVPPA
jgi:drug/metabolite transporter (DMT)-like permease